MKRNKILLVESEIRDRDLLQGFLIKLDYEVISTDNCQTAQAILKEFNPNLVILDTDVLDYSESNLYSELQNHEDIFRLMLTTKNMEADLASKNEYYLVKPFGLGELEVEIRSILKKHPKDSNSWSYDWIGENND